MRSNQLKQLHHLLGSRSLPMTFLQSLPEQVETRRPPSLGTPLGKRLRASKCPWFSVQHVQIMGQFQDLLTASRATLVNGNTMPALPDLYHGGPHFYLHFSSGI